jgi:hypothetical protein
MAQVVVSDNPSVTGSDTTYIFKVHSDGQPRFSIYDSGGVHIPGQLKVDSIQLNGPLSKLGTGHLKMHGMLEVDSLQVNGLVYVSNEGGSFIWRPNWPVPPPLHDLLRVTTGYFTVMGGNKFVSTPLTGFGINTETPNNMLDVNNGDIDVNTATRGYMIGDQYVLRHKNLTDNIYVGVDAGLSITGGPHNTFIGNGAGQNVTTSNDYTFVGYRAGHQNLGGSTNTFIGSMAGHSEMGDENVFVGWMSGYNTGQASYHNTFVGNVSGFNNQQGMNNTFIGIGSGNNNVNGSNHVALGASAGPGPAMANLFNTAAIGFGTMVMNSNDMILGDNTIQVGIGLNGDIAGPQNKLEIDAGINGMNPTPNSTLGASGLRLRDLHSFTTPSTNSRNVYLSVDNFGDVILVGAPTSSTGAADNGLSTSGPTAGLIHLGQSIAATGDPGRLLDSREVPMYTFNFYFKGDAGVNQDRMEMGDNTILPLTPITGAKLNVQTQTEHAAGLFVNRTNLANTGDTWGVGGLKLMGTNLQNIGVYGYGETDPSWAGNPPIPESIGVKGEAINRIPSGMGLPVSAYGVWGEATDNQTMNNYGGYFRAWNGQTNYAVFGDGGGFSSGNTPPTGPIYAGYFNGDVYISGTFGPSDQKLKRDIQSLDGALDIVMQIQPHTYYFREQDYPGMALPEGRQYGLIAQEVEQFLPELIMENVHPATTDPDGNVIYPAVDFKSMNYQELIPILIGAIQEQQELIEKQQAQIDLIMQQQSGKQ